MVNTKESPVTADAYAFIWLPALTELLDAYAFAEKPALSALFPQRIEFVISSDGIYKIIQDYLIGRPDLLTRMNPVNLEKSG